MYPQFYSRFFHNVNLWGKAFWVQFALCDIVMKQTGWQLQIFKNGDQSEMFKAAVKIMSPELLDPRSCSRNAVPKVPIPWGKFLQWKLNYIALLIDFLPLCPPGANHWTDRHNTLFSLEATGYALLTLVKLGHMNEAAAPFKWLNGQRRRGGGFGSTQVTAA